MNGETTKLDALEHVWAKAESGKLEIWTSAFCVAEVYKKRCGGILASLDEHLEAEIDNLFDQDFVKIVQLDVDVARRARKLLYTHKQLKKPSDAIHLATAILWDVDQLHTYDGCDLIGIVEKTADGRTLEICTPDKVDGDNLLNWSPAVAE